MTELNCEYFQPGQEEIKIPIPGTDLDLHASKLCTRKTQDPSLRAQCVIREIIREFTLDPHPVTTLMPCNGCNNNGHQGLIEIRISTHEESARENTRSIFATSTPFPH